MESVLTAGFIGDVIIATLFGPSTSIWQRSLETAQSIIRARAQLGTPRTGAMNVLFCCRAGVLAARMLMVLGRIMGTTDEA